ncbi:MAG: response regulator [Candidatus Dormibacteria bacterium]
MRVVVVDDHPVVRRGTLRILEAAGLEVVGDADSALGARELVNALAPDVVVADVRLPGTSGIELTVELKEDRPDVKVLILSAYGDPSYVRAALAAGASGYLLKTASDEELVSAVRSVALGATVLDAAVSADLISEAPRTAQPITDREREVLSLVIEGFSNKAIGAKLGVSQRTVDAHIAHLFSKLAVSSRTELVAWAARHGMVE